MARSFGSIAASTQSTIHVVATTLQGTRTALDAAVPLAKGTGARLVLTVPRIVPYGVDLDSPVDSSAFLVKHYRQMVAELGGDARIDICLCRRIDDVVPRLVAGDSTIVIGGPVGRWLASPEERFANRLGAGGRRVVFVACTTPVHRRLASSNTGNRTSTAAILAVLALMSASHLAVAGGSIADRSVSHEIRQGKW